MEIVQSFMTLNPCYRAGKRINVKGIVLHSVGCPQPSAEVFVKKMNSIEAKVCVHAFIDANTGKVYQTLPWDYKAWHCGGSGNSTHIGVEMCEPSCMKYTGGATIVCSDERRAGETVRRTLDAAVQLFAELCRKYGLDPMGKNVIVSHKEGHDRGMASGHGDPDHLFRQLHMNYTMDDFRKAVANEMNGIPASGAGDHADDKAAAMGAADDVGRDTQKADAPGQMRISDRGVELVASFEGCRLEAYRCPAGVWTIGYGHTAGVKPGDRLSSEEEAKKLLKEDLKKYGDYVNSCVKKGQITFPLNQNRFDALTSFCYNCGNGNLQKLVSGRDAETVANKLPAYNKGGGRVLPGLVRRREEERKLFLS